MNATPPHSPGRCLLCGHADTHVLHTIDTRRLADAYRSEIGVAIKFSVDALAYVRCNRCALLFFFPTVTGDEQFYGDLQKISWYYNAEKQEFRIAAGYIRNSHDVLEIGAGRGFFRGHISPASYTGLEFSPDAISAAMRSGIRLLPETIEHHAKTNAQRYDIVCAFQVLEHVAAPREFLEASIACLKPGGRLVVSVPGEDSFAKFLYWDVLNMPPHHVTRWTDACLRSIAETCNVKLVALTPEPLGRNMVKLYANAMADHSLATRLNIQPAPIDQRVKAPLFRLVSATVAAGIRRYLRIKRGERRGHAVLAVFER